MQVHPKWIPKYRTIWRPQYYDNINRSWDSANFGKRNNYRTQDPLWFDHEQEHLNGGVELLLEQLHDKANYQLPIKN